MTRVTRLRVVMPNYLGKADKSKLLRKFSFMSDIYMTQNIYDLLLQLFGDYNAQHRYIVASDGSGAYLELWSGYQPTPPIG
jgi:hypothetical protein